MPAARRKADKPQDVEMTEEPQPPIDPVPHEQTTRGFNIEGLPQSIISMLLLAPLAKFCSNNGQL